ncbi:MAG: hypothetical protein RLZZ238_2729, partial [Planctomycetota bacterium]
MILGLSSVVAALAVSISSPAQQSAPAPKISFDPPSVLSLA